MFAACPPRRGAARFAPAFRGPFRLAAELGAELGADATSPALPFRLLPARFERFAAVFLAAFFFAPVVFFAAVFFFAATAPPLGDPRPVGYTSWTRPAQGRCTPQGARTGGFPAQRAPSS